MEKTCECCRKKFITHPAVVDQRYCGEQACQKARKALWQREKLKKDADYRANQAAAQKEWRDRNPGYWRKYRAKHPDYVEKNRQRQRERNRQKRLTAKVAKMDALKDEKAIVSGCYELVPFCNGKVAKMDALIVRISPISMGCKPSRSDGP